MVALVDRILEERRLNQLYDPLNPDRRDLDTYAAMADEFGARSVFLDIGCGTGTFACFGDRRQRSAGDLSRDLHL